MQITFNIIYVPGTVRILLPLIYTLLEHAPVRLRLVDNGCTPEETALLTQAADEDERLTYFKLPGDEMIPHGKALEHIFALDQDEFFAFMDSDIFATGPWLEPLLEQLNEHAGCSSCLPVWHRLGDVIMPADYNVMGGRYVESCNGHFLGVTYLAMYRRSALHDVFSSTNLRFGSRQWRSLGSTQKEWLESKGLRARFYDSCKLLNIALQDAGHTLTFQEAPGLVHIGAISGLGHQNTSLYYAVRNKLIGFLPQRLRRTLRAYRYKGTPRVSAAERDNIDLLALRRIATQLYIDSLVLGDNGKSERHLECLDREMRKEIAALGEQILDIHRRYPLISP